MFIRGVLRCLPICRQIYVVFIFLNILPPALFLRHQQLLFRLWWSSQSAETVLPVCGCVFVCLCIGKANTSFCRRRFHRRCNRRSATASAKIIEKPNQARADLRSTESGQHQREHHSNTQTSSQPASQTQSIARATARRIVFDSMFTNAHNLTAQHSLFCSRHERVLFTTHVSQKNSIISVYGCPQMRSPDCSLC